MAATADVYKRLHSAFLELWNDPIAASLRIDVFAPSRVCEGFERVPDEPPFDRKRYELLAEVCVPIVPYGETFTQFGFAVLKRDYQVAKVQERFRSLCAEAGAHLPPHFRDQLAGYCSWHVTKPESWWVALLLYETGEAVRLPDGRSRENILLLRSVMLSVDAIQRYGLATDSPDLPSGGGGGRPSDPSPETQPPAGTPATPDTETGNLIVAEQEQAPETQPPAGKPAATADDGEGEGDPSYGEGRQSQDQVADLLEKLKEALLDDTSNRILQIASDESLSAEEKCRAICQMDVRYWAKDSEFWARLCSTTGQAIRKLDFWKVDRKKAHEEVSSAFSGSHTKQKLANTDMSQVFSWYKDGGWKEA
jgi:hypothetical protein